MGCAGRFTLALALVGCIYAENSAWTQSGTGTSTGTVTSTSASTTTGGTESTSTTTPTGTGGSSSGPDDTTGGTTGGPPGPATRPERGYIPRDCGFTIDPMDPRSAVECGVCDGSGNGGAVEYYVQCGAPPSPACVMGEPCCTPDEPCNDLRDAMDALEDGPEGPRAICFQGTCDLEAVALDVAGGTTGTYLRPPEGSEVSTFEYPSAPTLVVGWDCDADGVYPPVDKDHGCEFGSAVITGHRTMFSLAFPPGPVDSVELAHFAARDFEAETQAIPFAVQTAPMSHFFMHDVVIEGFRDGVRSESVGVLNAPNWRYAAEFWAFENLLFEDYGGWLWFVGPVELQSGGPRHISLRWKNITARGLGCAGCPGIEVPGAMFVSGFVRGVEILDSIFDSGAEPGVYEPDVEDSPSAIPDLVGVAVQECARDVVIRNNEFINYKSGLQLAAKGGGVTCGDTADAVEDVARDVVFDANVVRNDYPPLAPSTVPVRVIWGSGSPPNENVANVDIVNNVFLSSVGAQGCVEFDLYDSPGAAGEPITYAHNTCAASLTGPAWWLHNTSLLPASTHELTLVSNIFGTSDGFGARLEVASPTVIADNNVYTPGTRFNLADVEYESVPTWSAEAGVDDESEACKFTLAANGDLISGCPVNFAPFRPDPTLEQDIHGNVRPEQGPWDAGADELQ